MLKWGGILSNHLLRVQSHNQTREMKPDPATLYSQHSNESLSFSRAEIMDELDRVSRITLNKKTALQKMLRFVVEATLDGKAFALKEYTIATLVFGKSETFDPRMTSLVRTQASKLRHALLRHYGSCPAGSGPWLWVPTGSYSAVFDQNPALRAKGRTLEMQAQVESPLGNVVRIVAPNVFPRKGNLHEIAQAVVRLQRETFGSREFLAPVSETVDLELAAMQPYFPLEVAQTLVELDDRLLLTLFITAGPSHFVLFGNSVSIPWNGDVGKAIAALSVPLSQFAANCTSLLTSQAFSPNSPVSTAPKAAIWEECAVSDLPHVRPGVSSHDGLRSSV